MLFTRLTRVALHVAVAATLTSIAYADDRAPPATDPRDTGLDRFSGAVGVAVDSGAHPPLIVPRARYGRRTASGWEFGPGFQYWGFNAPFSGYAVFVESAWFGPVGSHNELGILLEVGGMGLSHDHTYFGPILGAGPIFRLWCGRNFAFEFGAGGTAWIGGGDGKLAGLTAASLWTGAVVRL